MGKKKKRLYPEHEKLAKVRDESQSIGEFLEWLSEKGIRLAAYHTHNEGCVNPDWHEGVNDGKDWLDDDHVEKIVCGGRENELVPIHYDTQKLLAEFFGIDLNRLEQEKRTMLQHLSEAG